MNVKPKKLFGLGKTLKTQGLYFVRTKHAVCVYLL